MGYRGFAHKNVAEVKPSASKEEYSRAPNLNARNYLDEMAPVNGITELTEGILMEDRNGVRTCVTCELFAESTKEGSRLIAEVPLDVGVDPGNSLETADGVAPGNSLLVSEEAPGSYRNETRITDIERRWAHECRHGRTQQQCLNPGSPGSKTKTSKV